MTSSCTCAKCVLCAATVKDLLLGTVCRLSNAVVGVPHAGTVRSVCHEPAPYKRVKHICGGRKAVNICKCGKPNPARNATTATNKASGQQLNLQMQSVCEVIRVSPMRFATPCNCTRHTHTEPGNKHIGEGVTGCVCLGHRCWSQRHSESLFCSRYHQSMSTTCSATDM